MKAIIHPAVGPPRGDQLQGQEHQQRQEEPTDEPERGQSLGDRKVILPGGFQRREVVGTDAQQMQTQRRGTAILDPQIDGLNAPPGQRHPEHLLAFGGVQHRHRHLGGGAGLHLSAGQKGAQQRLRPIRGRQQAPQQGRGMCHHRQSTPEPNGVNGGGTPPGCAPSPPVARPRKGAEFADVRRIRGFLTQGIPLVSDHLQTTDRRPTPVFRAGGSRPAQKNGWP